MNIVGLSGNLTADPELERTADDTPYCRFQIAVRRPKTSDKTDFIKCVAWRSTAEFIGKWFQKGKRIEISGVLISGNYEDSNGNKRTSMEVLVNDASFGERKQSGEDRPAESRQRESRRAHQDRPSVSDEEFYADDDDIPF